MYIANEIDNDGLLNGLSEEEQIGNTQLGFDSLIQISYAQDKILIGKSPLENV